MITRVISKTKYDVFLFTQNMPETKMNLTLKKKFSLIFEKEKENEHAVEFRVAIHALTFGAFIFARGAPFGSLRRPVTRGGGGGEPPVNNTPPPPVKIFPNTIF